MMMLLSRRSLLAIAAVVDIALHARPTPVAAKMLASRHNLPPRHLETVLQGLVRAGVLKGVRGPRGGYELARERRRINAAEIVRAAMTVTGEENLSPLPESRLVDKVVAPLVGRATEAFLARLEAVTIEELCRQADEHRVFGGAPATADFTI
jgi:Rrf2 family iron-sulfur cluster assembly transcriptional regulator